jgi:fatty-acyl-CoA synthase
MTVESAAMEHPALAQAAVVGVSHPRWQERPLRFAALKPGSTASRDQVIDYLSSRLPKWWLPDDVIFVKTLPMTASGKSCATLSRPGPLALPEVSIGGTGN